MIKRRPETIPKVVVYAVAVLFLAALVRAVDVILTGLTVSLAFTVVGLTMVGLVALLVSKIAQGRNWARITYLLYFLWLLSQMDWPLLLDIQNRYSEISAIQWIGLVLFVLQIWALYALFTFPGADWFLKPEKPAGEASPNSSPASQ